MANRNYTGTKTIAGKRYRIWTTVDSKRMANGIAAQLRKDSGHAGTGRVPKSVRVIKYKGWQYNAGDVWSVYYR